VEIHETAVMCTAVMKLTLIIVSCCLCPLGQALLLQEDHVGHYRLHACSWQTRLMFDISSLDLHLDHKSSDGTF